MSGSAQILLVEDDPSGRELAEFNLSEAGYDVTAVESAEEGLERAASTPFDLVITDLRLPGMDGMAMLRRLRAIGQQMPVLVITAYGNISSAVEAMKAGAFDFIGKPFNRDHLLMSVARALQTRSLTREVEHLRSRVGESSLIAVSEVMKRTLSVCDRVAQSDASILIVGETGSGKELVAQRIHARSPRVSEPFVAINCAAIPAELLESELFGHEKGAFTGAMRARKGRFRQADGGTLFLDEVAELPIDVQGKLLRVLEARVVDVVGRDAPVPVDVRVLAATHRQLDQRVASGEFREDLFYRLNVVDITVPPLRDRPEDIAPLVQHFVAELGQGRSYRIPRELLAELERRAWPGNVRQLRNACERLVLLSAHGELAIDDLPKERTDTPHSGDRSLQDWPPLPDDGLSLVDLEKRVIERVLALKQGNVTHAAQYLRIPRHVLAYRLSKYGISRDG